MEFRFDAFLIGLVIFSFIIAVGSGFITSIANEYEVDYDSRFSATYDTVNALENMTKNQKESVVGGELPETDLLDSSIKGATSALNLMTAPIETVTLISDEIKEQIPPGDTATLNITLYIKVALTIMTIFGLAYLFFRIRSW